MRGIAPRARTCHGRPGIDGQFLRVDGKIAVEEVAKMISNWSAAELDNREKTVLAFMEKFT